MALVHEKIIAVMRDVSAIPKDRNNASQGYKFRGIDDVINRMGQHLVEAGLVIAPNIRKREVHERVNSRGNPLFYVTVEVEYTIFSCSVPIRHSARGFDPCAMTSIRSSRDSISGACSSPDMETL